MPLKNDQICVANLHAIHSLMMALFSVWFPQRLCCLVGRGLLLPIFYMQFSTSWFDFRLLPFRSTARNLEYTHWQSKVYSIFTFPPPPLGAFNAQNSHSCKARKDHFSIECWNMVGTNVCDLYVKWNTKGRSMYFCSPKQNVVVEGRNWNMGLTCAFHCRPTNTAFAWKCILRP